MDFSLMLEYWFHIFCFIEKITFNNLNAKNNE